MTKMKQMTKIFALATVLLAFSATTFAQLSATATASATIVTPLSITKTVDMNFGKVAVTGAGTLILTPAGLLTPSANLTVQGGTVTAATFTVAGQAGQTYAVTLPPAATTLDDGATHTMTVDTWTSDYAAGGAIPATLHVGATLNVALGQVGGVYTSATPFTVTVNYN
jgi:hypothetical protein